MYALLIELERLLKCMVIVSAVVIVIGMKISGFYISDKNACLRTINK